MEQVIITCHFDFNTWVQYMCLFMYSSHEGVFARAWWQCPIQTCGLITAVLHWCFALLLPCFCALCLSNMAGISLFQACWNFWLRLLDWMQAVCIRAPRRANWYASSLFPILNECAHLSPHKAGSLRGLSALHAPQSQIKLACIQALLLYSFDKLEKTFLEQCGTHLKNAGILCCWCFWYTACCFRLLSSSSENWQKWI